MLGMASMVSIVAFVDLERSPPWVQAYIDVDYLVSLLSMCVFWYFMGTPHDGGGSDGGVGGGKPKDPKTDNKGIYVYIYINIYHILYICIHVIRVAVLLCHVFFFGREG